MTTRTRSVCHRFFALAGLLAGALALSAQPPVDPLKKLDPPKVDAKDAKDTKDAKPLVVKLPDGTLLWLGPTEGVTLTPQEFKKLLDQAETLKKELAARKPTAPSGCAIRGAVQKRGEQLVAVFKLTYSFRTTQANTAVALGGKKAFLVGAALDGAKLPVLDTGEDGFAVMVEAAGDHTFVLDVEAPVTARGTKAEVGFDLGLPRSPITTLALAAPPGDVKRVGLVTKTPDPTQPTKAPEVRRLTGLDVKQLAGAGADTGFPLGPVDSLEVTWDPPAAVANPADQVQSAEIDIGVTLTEGFVESSAKVKFRGPGREWKLVAPPNTDVSVDRVGAAGDVGPTQQPVVTKPAAGAKLVWKIEFPTGSAASDWIITAVVRQPRPKAGTKSAAVPIGPFTVLDVMRQTGTVKVTAGPHTRFVFTHGPDLRRVEQPGADDDTNSIAHFRLTTGPTGATAVNAPLLSVEAWPVEGAVRVKPTYRLKLTEAGWRVTAEVLVKPIRTEVDSLVIDVPAEWRGLESESDPELVEGVIQGKPEGAWRPVTVRLAAAWKQPFTVVLVATIPFLAGAREAAVALPRFPKATERDALVSASVPEGLEVRGTARGWDGDVPSVWAAPLAAVPGPDGKVPKAVSVVTGKGERGLSRVALSWQPYRPDVTAEITADVTVGERQIVVKQTIKLRSPDGFPRPVRLRGPTDALGLTAKPHLDSPAAGTWTFAPPVDARAPELKVSFALPLPAHSDGPVSVPVGLLWPVDASRAEAHVRVWVSSITGRTVTASAAGWRELPPEPVPDRDALPALTLTASAEHPLVMEVRQVPPEQAVAVWVDRALVEAWLTEDGSIGYRARFRIERWLGPAVDLWLPETAVSTVARVDGATVGLVPIGEGEGGKRFRVTMPENASGRTVVLDLQYAMPGSRGAFGDNVYVPPRLTSAAYIHGTRWFVTESSDSAPLVLSGGRADMKWRVRGPTFAPSAASRASMDRWFTATTEPGPGDTTNGTEGEPVVIRQTAPEPVRVARVPWLALVAGCSILLALLLYSMTWLPATVSGLMVALLGGAFGVGIVLYPQPGSQVVAAAQPGVLVGLIAIVVQTAILWYARRRVTHLPNFTRTPAEPSVVVPSTATGSAPSAPRGRSGSTGSAGSPVPMPVAPSGSGS